MEQAPVLRLEEKKSILPVLISYHIDTLFRIKTLPSNANLKDEMITYILGQNDSILKGNMLF